MKNLSIADILELDIRETDPTVGGHLRQHRYRPEAVPLTGAQRDELDRHLAHYYQNPGSPWNEVRQRIIRPE